MRTHILIRALQNVGRSNTQFIFYTCSLLFVRAQTWCVTRWFQALQWTQAFAACLIYLF